MARTLGDRTEYFRNIESLAGLYYYQQEWEKSKTYSIEVVKYGPKSRELESCYYFASQSYCHLGDIDSAKLLLQMAPLPTHERDSILWYRTMELLDRQSSDYKSSAANAQHADNVASQAIARKLRHDLQQIEYNQEKTQLEEKNRDLLHVNDSLILLIAVIVFAAGFAFFGGYRRYRQISSQLSEEQETLKAAKMQLGLFREQLALLTTTIENEATEPKTDGNAEMQRRQLLLHLIDTIFNSVVYSGKRGASILKYILDIQKEESTSIMSIKLMPSFWEELYTYIDEVYPNAFVRIAELGATINEKEKRVICLDCIRVPNALIALLLGYTERSTSSVRFRIIEKLGCQGMKFDQYLQELTQTSDSTTNKHLQ